MRYPAFLRSMSLRPMVLLALIFVGVFLTGCGEAVAVKDVNAEFVQEQTDKEQVARELKAAKAEAARAKLTNAELAQKNAEDEGVIKAAKEDIAANKAQMKLNDEAHWTLLAYIAAGVLSLAVLVLGFLAFESPVARMKFVTAATFCGLAAIACVWVGREIHMILELAPWILVIAAILGVWGAIDHRRVQAFFAGMWVKTSAELKSASPKAAASLDKAAIEAQGAARGLSDKLLTTARVQLHLKSVAAPPDHSTAA